MEIHIKPSVIGRYLQVELNATMRLAICELVAIGDCPRNKCGWDCSLKCFCSTDITGHYKIEGTCPYGCLKGWTCDGDKYDRGCSRNDLNCDQDYEMHTENTASVPRGYFHWTYLAGGGGSLGTFICILIVLIIILVRRDQRYKREQTQREEDAFNVYSAVQFGGEQQEEGQYANTLN